MLQIQQLIVVSGLSNAGKSTTLAKIRAGRAGPLCEQLGIINPADWTFLKSDKLAGLNQERLRSAILHFDIYGGSHNGGFAQLSALVANAGRANLLTLHAPPQLLRQRIRSELTHRLREGLILFGPRKKKSFASLKRLWAKYNFYRDAQKVNALYGAWFEFVNTLSFERHWILDGTDVQHGIAQAYSAEHLQQLIGFDHGK